MTDYLWKPNELYELVGGLTVPGPPRNGGWDDNPLAHCRTHWREDRFIMERICEHGVGHPDPDDKRVREGDGVHGCDGCCHRSNSHDPLRRIGGGVWVASARGIEGEGGW